MGLFSWLFKKKKQQENLNTLSGKSFDLIVKYEVSSESYYNRYLRRPTWPKAASGVTIGIGYDLGYNTVAGFKKDWGHLLSSADIKALSKVIGYKGQEASGYVNQVKHITIPWEDALEVFKYSTLDKFIEQTKQAFPKSEELHQDAFGALVSIVFNRGASMRGDRRSEMRRIRDLVPSKDYRGIAAEIRNMKRLWINRGLEGLLKRREAEAELVESCA